MVAGQVLDVAATPHGLVVSIQTSDQKSTVLRLLLSELDNSKETNNASSLLNELDSIALFYGVVSDSSDLDLVKAEVSETHPNPLDTENCQSFLAS